jgi:4-diphosphocytidyl-2C-methyl-D-erythritol kinase
MSSRGKLSSSTTSLNRSKQNTNNRTKTTKEKKNVQTVHEQEINQLESYVRNRNKELDEEINSIRNKLKSSSLSAVVNDKSGSSRFKTSAEDGNLKKMSFTSDGLAFVVKGIG